MRFILSMTAVLAVALCVLTACQNSAAPLKTENTNTTNTTKNTSPKSVTKTNEQEHTDDAPRISLADAKKDFDAGTAVFVDTRAESAYKQEHVKGAINLPMEAFEMRYKEIPAGKKIIAYCS
jgi:3-mercaptopyruvate sulfurtransferase SseA